MTRRRGKDVIDPRPVLGAALRAANLSAGPRLVALALWAYADYRTGEAYPSLVTIAELSGVDYRHVRRCVDQLEASGIIAVDQRPGRCAVYRRRSAPLRRRGRLAPLQDQRQRHRGPSRPAPKRRPATSLPIWASGGRRRSARWTSESWRSPSRGCFLSAMLRRLFGSTWNPRGNHGNRRPATRLPIWRNSRNSNRNSRSGPRSLFDGGNHVNGGTNHGYHDVFAECRGGRSRGGSS